MITEEAFMDIYGKWQKEMRKRYHVQMTILDHCDIPISIGTVQLCAGVCGEVGFSFSMVMDSAT